MNTNRVFWSEEKNQKLKDERNISFEDIEKAILEKKVLDIIPHYNKEKYPHQKIIIVKLNNYIHYVPFVIDWDKFFLKNIIPSRKLNKIYNKK